MTIHCNKNITKQLNNYSYVIAITLQNLLQPTKQALEIKLVDFGIQSFHHLYKHACIPL